VSWRTLWRTSAKWQTLWRSWRKMKMKCLCNCHSNGRLSFKRLSDKNKVTCVTMTRVCVYTFVKGCVEVMPLVYVLHTQTIIHVHTTCNQSIFSSYSFGIKVDHFVYNLTSMRLTTSCTTSRL